MNFYLQTMSLVFVGLIFWIVTLEKYPKEDILKGAAIGGAISIIGLYTGLNSVPNSIPMIISVMMVGVGSLCPYIYPEYIEKKSTKQDNDTSNGGIEQ